MKTHFSLLLGAALFTASVHAQDHATQSAALSPQFKQTAMQWMLSTDAARRQAAYRSWTQLDASSMPAYREALSAAASNYSKRLDELCRDRTNPYKAFNDIAAKLGSERKRVLELIKTDWKKDPAKIKMIRQEISNLEKLWTHYSRQAAVNTDKFDASLEVFVAALGELAREEERFDVNSETKHMDGSQLREHLMRTNIHCREILTQRDLVKAARKADADLAEAKKKNAASGRWATVVMKNFATILNKDRAIVGMNPLLLDEKLSAACAGHSKDMSTLKFFAHESPVEGKKTPWDRIRLAGFEGSGAGENLYHGAGNTDAAYDGWFASDGHRFNLFCDANALGVGINGTYWTMICGNKQVPE